MINYRYRSKNRSGWPVRAALLIIPSVFLCFSTLSWAASEDDRIPFTLPPAGALRLLRSAVIDTSEGKVVVELFPESAPWHVANFKYLADLGYYRDKEIDVVSEGYLVQGGAPTSAERKAFRYTLPAEFSERKNVAGALGMARKPDYLNNAARRSSSTQFHFLLIDDQRMDGSYTVFGRVVKGMPVVHRLSKGSKIKSVTVFVAENR